MKQERKLSEIWMADWVFYTERIVNKKEKISVKCEYRIEGIVTPKLPNFYLISQPFYIDRALRDIGETMKNSLVKDRATKLPYAKIEFKKFINHSFVDYYE